MKKFFVDTETTGLYANKHAIIQIAYLIDIDGEIKEEGNLFIKPFPDQDIDPKALKINGRTIEELNNFMEPQQAHKILLSALGKYCDRYNKTDKFTPVGYNVKFDLDFIYQFFRNNGDRYYGSWFNWCAADPMHFVYYTLSTGRFPQLPNYKLETICQYFGIEINAHDARSDIKATRELYYLLENKYLID
jgi:DNA polymerase-3 subunit epsilon